jgi:hypothetical protein
MLLLLLLVLLIILSVCVRAAAPCLAATHLQDWRLSCKHLLLLLLWQTVL